VAQPNAGKPLLASVFAAIGASACCLGPLVLLSLGIGGAWIGNLTALEPYQPIFIGLTGLFLALAFRKLYLAPASCSACVDQAAIRRQRLLFWLVALLLAVVLSVPLIAPLFY